MFESIKSALTLKNVAKAVVVVGAVAAAVVYREQIGDAATVAMNKVSDLFSKTEVPVEPTVSA